VNTAPLLMAAAFIMLACPWVRADTFYMKSGNEIEGTVVSEDASSMMVDIGYGTVSLEKAEILRIRRATKAQREASAAELRRKKYSSGALAPKGAGKLAGLVRAALAGRKKASEARAVSAARVAELKETENELGLLRKRYIELSEELGGIDMQADPSEYNRMVGDVNAVGSRIRIKETGMQQARLQGDKPDSSFQEYLDSYNKLESYLRGEGERLIKTPRKGKDGEYYSWLRAELVKMKKDFSRDSVESEGRNGHIIVKALLNGRVTARLMVDTGATTTTLYDNVASALKLDSKDPPKAVDIILGDGRTVKAQEVLLDSIAVGKSEVKYSAAIILPAQSGDIDGLLGMSFLRHFVVRVDSANGKLILEGMK
jgi:clan AA aspartic protease (TIGR02281 family)